MQRIFPTPALLLAALAGCQASASDVAASIGASDVTVTGAAAADAPATSAARLRPGFDGYHRPVSTRSIEAQAFVDQGMQWLFGFNDDEAIRCFQRSAQLDPTCAFAWWGIAYANGINVNDPVLSEREALDAWRAVQEAQARVEHASGVERALIDAVAARYTSPQPGDVKLMEQAHAEAMERVWRAYPHDADVGALFAESLMNLQPWDYWTRAGEPKGRATEIVAVLERVLELRPNHPGAIHYYIHAVEASQHPELAETAAERLVHLVPGSGHLTHMPSHIFVRVGRYTDAANANELAIAADRSYLASAPEQDYYGLYIAHNLHFLAYASMMEGRFEKALEAARAMETDVPSTFMERYPMIADGWSAAAPHVLVRFGKWQEIFELPEYPESRPISRAMRRYARSIAHSALGRVDEARAEIDAFEREAARTPTDWTIGFNPAHAVYPLARKMMAGELAFRTGDHERAFMELRAGVAIEDELLYDEPPSWLQPTRHALGALLMAAGRYAEAEEVYEQDLARNPRNGWALLGLENARRRLGETEGLDELARARARSWSRADLSPTSSCYCEPGAVDLASR